MPVDHVRVISPFVGGAFGSAGQTWPHQLLAVLRGPPDRQPGQAGADPGADRTRGSATDRPAGSAWRSAPTGPAASAPSSTRAARRRRATRTYEDGLTASPKFMYTSPNMRSTYRVVPLDVNQPTYMRGPGATTGTFALESAMDDLAHGIGIDPIELRLRNEPDRDQTDGLPFSTRRLTECLRQGADEFGWARRNPVAACGPRRRPADRHRDGRRGLSHQPQRIRRAGPDQRRRHRRRADRDQ